MTVVLKKISDREIRVNEKPVHKNMDDVWIAQEELKPSEEKIFKRYLRTLTQSSSGVEIRIFHEI